MSISKRMDDESETQWSAVLLLFLSGCSVALHIGKVPAALPFLREQFQLTLTQSGLVVSLYSLLIASVGVLLGFYVKRFGYVAFAATGLALVSIGSLAGSLSVMFQWLLFTRALEGFGWIMAAIAFPSILTALAAARDRPLVLGIWGAFVPLGAGVMLVLTPWLQETGGWQLTWQVAGALSVVALIIFLWITRIKGSQLSRLREGDKRIPGNALKNPVVWLFSLCFLFYSCQFVGLTSFLPTLFIETSDWSLANASRLVALVVLANVSGNVLAGYLLRYGVGHVLLLLIGAAGMGLCALVVFTESLGMPARIICAVMFSALGGLIPGTLFASLPKASSNPLAIGLLIGLILQFAGLGQLLGGVLLPAVVELFHSWQAAGVLCLCMGLSGCTAAALIPRIDKNR